MQLLDLVLAHKFRSLLILIMLCSFLYTWEEFSWKTTWPTYHTVNGIWGMIVFISALLIFGVTFIPIVFNF